MAKFIYVFDAADRDTLLAAGYSLLKEDVANNIYVFYNGTAESTTFALDAMEYCFSNTLMF